MTIFSIACILFSVIGSVLCNNHSVQLVVAHWQGDVSWTKEFTGIPKENIFVYQKHSPNKEMYVENTGNECHPYVRHIVDHYNKLADYTIFLHDLPAKHCKNYMDYLNSAPVYASKEDKNNNKPRDLVFFTDMYRNNSEHRLRLYIPELFTYYEKWMGHKMASWGTSIWCNGQFQVHRDLIRLRSHEFWKELLRDMKSSDASHGTQHGIYVCGYLEQVWHELFGKPAVTPLYSPSFVNGKEMAMCNRDPKDTTTGENN